MLVSLKADNVTLVDSLWGMEFVLIAWLCLFLGDGGALRGRLLVAITAIWGLRLTIYLTLRNWGKGEDPRYAPGAVATGTAFAW